MDQVAKAALREQAARLMDDLVIARLRRARQRRSRRPGPANPGPAADKETGELEEIISLLQEELEIERMGSGEGESSAAADLARALMHTNDQLRALKDENRRLKGDLANGIIPSRLRDAILAEEASGPREVVTGRKRAGRPQRMEASGAKRARDAGDQDAARPSGTTETNEVPSDSESEVIREESAVDSESEVIREESAAGKEVAAERGGSEKKRVLGDISNKKLRR